MVKVFLLTLCVFVSSILSQQKGLRIDPLHEIFCQAEETTDTITFNLTPIGTIWDVDWPTSTTKTFTIDTDGSSDVGLFYAAPNPSVIEGYNYIASTENPNYNQEDFGFGLYKLSVHNDYIYLDWRDTRYGFYSYCTGHCSDIHIKYDFKDNEFSISQDHTPYDWDRLYNGEYLKIWEMKGQGIPETDDAPNFWTNCLIMENKNNHPYLIWGAHPNMSVTSYKFIEV